MADKWKIYLTEYIDGDYVLVGHNIIAKDLRTAEAICEELYVGHWVCGRLDEVVPLDGLWRLYEGENN